MKVVQWEPSCFSRMDGRTDGQRDMKKLIVNFRNFAKASTNKIMNFNL